MILRNLIFKTEVVKQRLRAGMVSHHEQQASKCHAEQQHRELWPAYNANVAPSQASTEGLFQQTQAFSPLCAFCSPKSVSVSAMAMLRQPFGSSDQPSCIKESQDSDNGDEQPRQEEHYSSHTGGNGPPFTPPK